MTDVCIILYIRTFQFQAKVCFTFGYSAMVKWLTPRTKSPTTPTWGVVCTTWRSLWQRHTTTLPTTLSSRFRSVWWKYDVCDFSSPLLYYMLYIFPHWSLTCMRPCIGALVAQIVRQLILFIISRNFTCTLAPFIEGERLLFSLFHLPSYSVLYENIPVKLGISDDISFTIVVIQHHIVLTVLWIQDGLKDVRIHGGAAAVNQLTPLYVNMSTGSDYLCDFDTGDNESFRRNYTSNAVHSDTVWVTYSNPGVYTVKVLCYNNVSEKEDHAEVTVLNPIVGLRLESFGTPVGSPFSLIFTIESGSAPHFTLLFDDAEKSVSYDPGALTGRSELIASLPLGVYGIVLTAENAVSRVNITTNFTIAIPIADASSFVSESWAMIGMPLEFAVRLVAGSGVSIVWRFNDSSSDDSVSTSPLDKWPPGGLRSSIHTFVDPGEYVVSVTVGNSLGEPHLFTHEILIYGPVDNMTLTCNSPVPLVSEGGNAELRFVTSGFPPTSAFVVFDYGDGDVSDKLTFDIATMHPHRYMKQGHFFVTANVSNRFTVATYNTTIFVSVAVQDMHIFVRPPAVVVGEPVVVGVTLEKGSDVTLRLDWGETIVESTRRGLETTFISNIFFFYNIHENTSLLPFIYSILLLKSVCRS